MDRRLKNGQRLCDFLTRASGSDAFTERTCAAKSPTSSKLEPHAVLGLGPKSGIPLVRVMCFTLPIDVEGDLPGEFWLNDAQWNRL